MVSHVLIATDGSRLSGKVVNAGIVFARQSGAKLTIYHAIEFVPSYADGGFVPPSVLEQFEAGLRKQAQKYLEEATKVAQAAAVPWETQISRQATVY